jgi:hypothetical protein
MPFCQRMSQLRGREPETSHKRQVEQQFKGSGNAVRLVSIASAHASRMVMQGVAISR